MSRSSVWILPAIPIGLSDSTMLSRVTSASADPIEDLMSALIARLFIMPVPLASRLNTVPLAKRSRPSGFFSSVHCERKWSSPLLVKENPLSLASRYVSVISGSPASLPSAVPLNLPETELTFMSLNVKSSIYPDIVPDTSILRLFPMSSGAKYEMVLKSRLLSRISPSIFTRLMKSWNALTLS